ncbi:helix-turn-helix transcriptional regulator [Streptomyces sp. BH-SS-21]|uniref:Helix-turn-helix transcriptional regulator n=1 Tax=Streptomyces liliiviolaceus TaxID=2823109 RepID=A0A941B5Q5_9ACTN|nr:helix-turn-helix transcriptional regulator [Streptomyces liliiviolaceus]MBQ0848142.1 helix-turn-helix transcriptional regulator [Streptomyces liliiviolaceus]
MSDEGPQQGVLLSGEANVAVRIKLEREARGWSTNALSDRLNEAGFEMNPSAVWRIENGKRRINLDEAIGFAEVFGLALRNLVGPPQLAAQARAMELIDAVVDAFRETQRANAAYAKASDALDAYLAEHPDIREEADVMVSNAMAEASTKHLLETYGPQPGEHRDADPADEV